MKIIADEEAVQKITQLADATLKAHWTNWMQLVSLVLWAIEMLPEPKEPTPGIEVKKPVKKK